MVYCETCGKIAEYDRNEWAKYTFEDEEELIDIYKCECGEETVVRNQREEWNRKKEAEKESEEVE